MRILHIRVSEDESNPSMLRTCANDAPRSPSEAVFYERRVGSVSRISGTRGVRDRRGKGSPRDVLLGTTVANRVRSFRRGIMIVREVMKTAVATCAPESDLGAVIKTIVTS